MSSVSQQVVLRHPLQGVPQANDFEVIETPLPALANRHLRIRHHYIALDPWQRSAIAGRHSPDQQPLGQGALPPAEVIGEVCESRHPQFAVGATVRLMGGWQTCSDSDGSGVRQLDAAATSPLSAYLGVLGMPGLTAWASIVRLAEVAAGQTVLVSAAHGPVGSMVGQLAQHFGARAVGIAGSAEKCRQVTDTLGFAACVNYKDPEYKKQLRSVLPTGADVYHDNVGGQMLIDACGLMREYGTVILCGLISQYNDPALAVDLPVALPIMKRLTMKGLVVYDHQEAEEEFLATAEPLIASGEVQYLEDVAHGIEACGAHFAKLMRGDNAGKTLVRI